jgi:hypothetical protein
MITDLIEILSGELAALPAIARRCHFYGKPIGPSYYFLAT